MTFEKMIEQEMRRVRTELRKIDSLARFCVEIEMTGRVHAGDVKIEYSLSEAGYGDDKVTGSTLQPVLEEFMRRQGWEAVHAAKALTYENGDGEIAGNEEIPF